jgi:hypothetical protein
MERSIQLAERPGSNRVWPILTARTRASRVFGRLAGNLTGTAIVLACIALPLGLRQLSIVAEEATTVQYIEALRVAEVAPPLAGPAGLIEGLPPLLDRHYYFVNGCVAAPGDCAGAGPADWGEYYAELRLLYGEAAQAAECAQPQAFEQWAAGHTHFLTSETAAAGAYSLAQALKDNPASGDVHFVGTSAGGAAVFTYLSKAMRGEMPLHRRIRSVMTVDSPLGYQSPFTTDDLLSGFQAGSMKTDVEPGIGEWAMAANIAILTIDTRQDIVGYDPLPHVANDPNPTYPQSDTPAVSAYLSCWSLPCRLEHMAEYLDLGSVWHIYTGSHMSDSARQFAGEHWR